MMEERKKHWETIYKTKQPHEVGWTQEVPVTSLRFIQGLKLPKTANIIDIGGGDSKLVDSLLEMGYHNITVLDISREAIERVKKRLGEKGKGVKWIVSDILDFKPEEKYDLWHDRAAFHFLTSGPDKMRYLDTARSAVTGFAIIGTFSTDGPKKCSGLEISQYDEDRLQDLLAPGFTKTECITEDHTTPFNTKQNFLFCCFRRNPVPID